MHLTYKRQHMLLLAVVIVGFIAAILIAAKAMGFDELFILTMP